MLRYGELDEVAMKLLIGYVEIVMTIRCFHPN
jgi:hypothetical protein